MLMRRIVGLSVAAGLAAAGHAGPLGPEARAGGAAPAAAAAVVAPPVDEIVARHVRARGGLEAWRAVRSMRLSGRMDVGKGLQVPFTLQLKRPRKMRLEFLFDGQMVVQAFDGKAGWKRRPYLGRDGYELFKAQELEAAAGQAELDGPLIDYRAKGHRVVLLGRETVEGREAFKLAVTLSTGTVRHIYLDAESALEVKVDGSRRLRGKDHGMQTFYRDYRAVEGLLVPHTLETRVDGAPGSNKLLVDGVEINPDLAEGLFAPPRS